jgi:DNA-binding CsgD family transcriptional regulator
MALDHLTEVIPDIANARHLPQLRGRLPAVEAWRPTPFDRMDAGVVIVDCNFGITFANHAARELLAEGDGVRQRNDGIAAGTQAATLVLRRVIAAGWSGGDCQLPRAGGRALLSVLAVPLPTDAFCTTGCGHATILFLADPDRDHHQRVGSLVRQFGLTRAEGVFLVEIVKADGLQAAADRLGISLATARTHLRHIFEKTGARRQAELVRLATIGTGAPRNAVARPDDDGRGELSATAARGGRPPGSGMRVSWSPVP